VGELDAPSFRPVDQGSTFWPCFAPPISRTVGLRWFSGVPNVHSTTIEHDLYYLSTILANQSFHIWLCKVEVKELASKTSNPSIST
jgi:hypothetical protein